MVTGTDGDQLIVTDVSGGKLVVTNISGDELRPRSLVAFRMYRYLTLNSYSHETGTGLARFKDEQKTIRQQTPETVQYDEFCLNLFVILPYTLSLTNFTNL